MQEATLRGDYAAALELQDRLMPLHKAIFTEPGLRGKICNVGIGIMF